MKIFGLAVFTILSIFGGSYLTSENSPWTLTNNSKEKTSLSWAKFEWTNETLSGKYFERTAMFVPCKIDGISNICTLQFDLGANHTGVYENNFSSFYKQNPQLKERIKNTLNGRLQFWWSWRNLENMDLSFGNYIAVNKLAYVYKNQGNRIDPLNPNDTIHIGTMGADLFKDKVLIIDYPKKQFAICENIPKVYENNLIDIEISRSGKIILPMSMHNKKYRIQFDNGSSIFPLLTLAKHTPNFSTSPDIDTIKVSSWGKLHDVTGKIIKDTFELAGQKFSNIKVYTTGYGINSNTDGLTGNALFWDKKIIIDFKNKKFGVQ